MDNEALHKAYIGLGANLGDRLAMLVGAIEALNGADIQVLRVSSVYFTHYVGPLPDPQPDFLNGVAEVETPLTPWELLNRLLQIEERFGRPVLNRAGPRPLDLDLLLFDDLVLQSPSLSIPHPRMWDRAFVLRPLAELIPHWLTPYGKTVSERARELLQLGQRVTWFCAWPRTERVAVDGPVDGPRSGQIRPMYENV